MTEPIKISETEAQCLEWLGTLPTLEQMIASVGVPAEMLGPSPMRGNLAQIECGRILEEFSETFARNFGLPRG